MASTLPSLTADQLLQLLELQSLAARDGFALVALPARDAAALIDVVNFARPKVTADDLHMPAATTATTATHEISEVLTAHGLWTR